MDGADGEGAQVHAVDGDHFGLACVVVGLVQLDLEVALLQVVVGALVLALALEGPPL